MSKVIKSNSLSGYHIADDAITMDQLKQVLAVLLRPLNLRLKAAEEAIKETDQEADRYRNVTTRLMQFLASDGMEVWKDRQFIDGIPTGGTFIGRTLLDIDAFSKFTAEVKLMEEQADAAKG